jgi:hypothetical protein
MFRGVGPTPDQPLVAEPTPKAPIGTPHYGDFSHPAEAQRSDLAEHPACRVYVGGYLDPSGKQGGCSVPQRPYPAA